MDMNEVNEFVPDLELPHKQRLGSCVTVVGRTYFQNHDQQPVTSEDSYHYYLDSQEEPYSYRAKLGPEWVPLEFGWLKDVSFVRVQNDEGRYGQSTPLEELERRIIQVQFSDGQESSTWLVRHGRAFQGEPMNAGAIRIRAESRTTGTITLYPR